VAENDLVPLPPAKFTNRLDCTLAGLIIHDPLGRPFTVEWQHVMLVAMGNVLVTELKRVEKEVQPTRDENTRFQTRPRIEYSTKEERTSKFMMDIVLNHAVLRYSLNIDSRIPFRYLESRATPNLAANVSLVMQDMAGFAPHIGFTRGAFCFREKVDPPLVYPSKNAFYEETTWLLWQMKKAGKI
jgi:hypothetical protein